MVTGDGKGEVRAILGADRPEDALKRLHEALANEDLKGVIIATVSKDGRADTRVFGDVWNQELAWVGTQLVAEAHRE